MQYICISIEFPLAQQDLCTLVGFAQLSTITCSQNNMVVT